MELWDIYDSTFEKTGRQHQRGIPLNAGEYHLVALMIPVNSKGQLLIQKRADTVKLEPGMWAFTGGSAVTGETAWQACKRELLEELGIEADKENSELMYTIKRKDSFASVWLIHTDISANDLKLQEEEVSQARWAEPDEIRNLIAAGEFHRYDFIEWLFGYLNRNK